jgi:PhzF family phenazine biosynthesis protein
MQQRPFKQVDVFTATPYYGNPLAVVLDGTGLTDDQMQRFARWTNLSETTFLLQPTAAGAARGADYQVRIFTTSYEMPFAGHPTLGSCHAWLDHGGVPKTAGIVVQECQVGLVTIRHAARNAFAAPALRRSDAAPELVQALTDALGLPRSAVLASQHLNNGPSHFGLLLDSQQRVLDLAPDFSQLRAAMQGAAITGVGVASVHGGEAASVGLIVRSNREARAFTGISSSASAAVNSQEDPDVEVRSSLTTVTVWAKTRLPGASTQAWRNGSLPRAVHREATWRRRAPASGCKDASTSTRMLRGKCGSAATR